MRHAGQQGSWHSITCHTLPKNFLSSNLEASIYLPVVRTSIWWMRLPVSLSRSIGISLLQFSSQIIAQIIVLPILSIFVAVSGQLFLPFLSVRTHQAHHHHPRPSPSETAEKCQDLSARPGGGGVVSQHLLPARRGEKLFRPTDDGRLRAVAQLAETKAVI